MVFCFITVLWVFANYLHLSLAFIGLRFVLFVLLGFQNGVWEWVGGRIADFVEY